MKNLKRIDEAVGSILERRAAADRLLKDVVNGNASEVEGIKLSKEMAQGFLDWLKYSTYGKKFGALPFYKLFTASFNWGLDRFVKGANTELKAEFKELKAKASEMRKAEKFESVDEAIDLIKSTWRGTKGWNDVARVMNAGLMKAIKSGSIDIGYAKDYVKSLERMAKRNAKKFFNDYGNFSEDDFIEDVEYNMANESKVNEASLGHAEVKKVIKGMSQKNKIALERAIKDGTIKTSEDLSNWAKSINEAKKLGLGDKGVDYNDNVVEIIEIGKFDKVAKRFKKEMKADAEDYGFEKGAGEFYLTKNIEATEGNVGDLAIYPVKYDMSNYWGLDPLKESINEAKFSFSEDEVKDVAEVIAKAIEKMDNMKTAVHDMEYDAGRGAGFEISMGGDKYEGGSYVVRPNGEVYNAAIGNSFPNAIYAKIGDTDIRKVMKNIKKFESVEVNEAKFVKSYDTKVNSAETEKDVKKIYPKYKKIGVGKLTHFFGELEPNLFFKARYPKYYKQDTGKSVKGDFKIVSVYSFRNGNGVELMKESIMENFKTYGEFVSENYDTEQRKEMAKKGFALSDGSFPIANLEDLKNAIMAYGRAKDQARAAKFIAKRAKALGAEDLIPDSEDFQKSLKEDVATQVPAKTIAFDADDYENQPFAD